MNRLNGYATPAARVAAGACLLLAAQGVMAQAVEVAADRSRVGEKMIFGKREPIT